MRYILLGFAIAVTAITYANVRKGQAPPPSEFTGAVIIYGIAGVGSELSPGLGVFLALTYTVGLLYGLANKTSVPFVPGKLQTEVPS
jgi:hypothetical protein